MACTTDQHEGQQLDITRQGDEAIDGGVQRFHCGTCGVEYTVPANYPDEDDFPTL